MDRRIAVCALLCGACEPAAAPAACGIDQPADDLRVGAIPCDGPIVDTPPALGELAERESCLAGVHPAGQCFVAYHEYENDGGEPIHVVLALRLGSGPWIYAWANTNPYLLARAWVEDSGGPHCIYAPDRLHYMFTQHNWRDVAQATTEAGTQYTFRATFDVDTHTGWHYTLESQPAGGVLGPALPLRVVDRSCVPPAPACAIFDACRPPGG